jgi:hypothetical protein
LDLLGLAAPRMSMSLKASVELDSENETLQAELAEAYSQALEEKERSSPTSGAQLATARDLGPPALTVLAGKPRYRMNADSVRRQLGSMRLMQGEELSSARSATLRAVQRRPAGTKYHPLRVMTTYHGRADADSAVSG